MNSVLGRFRESRLAEWLIAYLAFAWLTVQIVDVIAEVWDISDVLQRRVHVGLAFGVPATAVLAWFHGEQGKQRVTRSELFILAALAGLASLALPSVGAAGIEPVFGIPATVVVPCTLVTMVLIPISLIIVSVRITQKHRPGIAPEEPEEALSKQEKKLWDDLLSATTQEDVFRARKKISHLPSLDLPPARISALELALTQVEKRIAASADVLTDVFGAESTQVQDRQVEVLDEAIGTPPHGRPLGLSTEKRDSLIRRLQKEVKRRHVSKAAFAYVLVLIGSALFLSPMTMTANKPARALPEANTLTVLPFVPLQDDSSSEWADPTTAIADGLTEDVISALSEIPELRMQLRTSSFSFPSNELNPEDFARLGVDHVVTGSFNLAENRLRVTAQIIETHGGTVSWSDDFDGGVEDLPFVASEIAATVAETLGDQPQSGSDRPGDFQLLGMLGAVLVVFFFSVLIVLTWFHGRDTKASTT